MTEPKPLAVKAENPVSKVKPTLEKAKALFDKGWIYQDDWRKTAALITLGFLAGTYIAFRLVNKGQRKSLTRIVEKPCQDCAEQRKKIADEWTARTAWWKEVEHDYRARHGMPEEIKIPPIHIPPPGPPAEVGNTPAMESFLAQAQPPSTNGHKPAPPNIEQPDTEESRIARSFSAQGLPDAE